jgi:hypothetical protein
MFGKIVHLVLALTLACAVGASFADEAQAHDGAGMAAGVAAGIIGLGILGATARPRYYYDVYDAPPPCYHGPRTCTWEHRYCFENSYGDYVCRGGEYICRRPLICE